MERIHYAGGDVLTGSDIAKAVLEYAQALAETNQSATVGVPARHEDGSVGQAHLLIGPSSQLISETEEGEFEELEDDVLVAQFVASTRKLREEPQVVASHPDLDQHDVELDIELGLNSATERL